MRTTIAKHLKPVQSKDKLVFGKFFTDHMLSQDYKDGKWQEQEIHPYRKLELDPSASCFHYAIECFEGMKAYRTGSQLRLFRPDMNMARLKKSVDRLALPAVDSDALLRGIKELVKLDQRHIPSERGYSLYIRPTVIGTQPTLGVGASKKAKLFTICSPVGPYYPTGFNAVSLLADPRNIRSWPGGVGDCKVGANYAPGILTQMAAAKDGFQQNLWLFPYQDTHQVTEVGTMNMFVVFKRGSDYELATPKLDGTILPGVTRDSILQLARNPIESKFKRPFQSIKVSERIITMTELFEAQKKNELVEIFGSGTAAVVSPVKAIRYVNQGKVQDLKVPLDPNNPQSQAGPLARYFNDLIVGIQYGEVEHPFSQVI